MYIAAGQGQTTPGDKILMSTETRQKFWWQQKTLVISVICYKCQKNLFEVWFYTIFFITLYMYIAPGQGLTNLGDEILMSTGTSCHFGHLLQVSKKSLWSLILYIVFHDLYMYISWFIHVYSARAGADSPQGTKFWFQQKYLVTSFICCKFQKNLFEVWFYTIFFITLYMYIAPGQGLTNLGNEILMSTGTSCHFGHLLQVSKKSLWSLILYIVFHDLYMYISWFIHVYSARAGADSPQGTKFWFQQKYLVTSFICCKFQKNVFKVLILYNLFHDLIHVYSPWAGVDNPRGQNFDVNRRLYHFTHLL